MTPTGWLSAVLFLLFVAPGLLFDLLSERRRASVEESSFREASRVALSSLVFTTAAWAILWLVGKIRPTLVPNVAELVSKPGAYTRLHYELLAWTVAAAFLLALFLAWAWNGYLGRRAGGQTIRSQSAWTKVFRRDVPQGAEPHVRVRLDDGLVYMGRLADFSPDFAHEDRELILAPPLFVASGDADFEEVPEDVQRVVIRGTAVRSLSVEYWPETTAADTQ